MAQQFFRSPSQVPSFQRNPVATVGDLQKQFRGKFKTFSEAFNYADVAPGIYQAAGVRENQRKRQVGAWLESINAPEGGYAYDYSRKTSGPSIDYGQSEGDWQIKRTWEGRPGRGVGQIPGYSTGTSIAEMPSYWSPGASQFPWQARKGISSDFSRQQAFMQGFGGTEGAMRRPTFRSGQTFNPQTGFAGKPMFMMGGGFPGGINKNPQKTKQAQARVKSIFNTISSANRNRLSFRSRTL